MLVTYTTVSYKKKKKTSYIRDVCVGGDDQGALRVVMVMVVEVVMVMVMMVVLVVRWC